MEMILEMESRCFGGVDYRVLTRFCHLTLAVTTDSGSQMSPRQVESCILFTSKPLVSRSISLVTAQQPQTTDAYSNSLFYLTQTRLRFPDTSQPSRSP